jgi:hypothetical protein
VPSSELPPVETAALVAVPSALFAASLLPRLKGRVLCLHGFRSSGEMLQVALAPLLAAAGASGSSQRAFEGLSFEFLNAPHVSSGPPEPGIPAEVPTYEWWGRPGAYADGWRHFGPKERFAASRAAVVAAALEPRATAARGPVVGLVGFSQGAAMCVALAADPDATSQLRHLRFLAAFSAVSPRNVGAALPAHDDDVLPAGCPPPPGNLRGLASLHVFDPTEAHASLCREVHSFFGGLAGGASGELAGPAADVLLHAAGHAIPRRGPAVAPLAEAFRYFVEAALAHFEEAKTSHGRI